MRGGMTGQIKRAGTVLALTTLLLAAGSACAQTDAPAPKAPTVKQTLLEGGSKPPVLNGMNAANAYLDLWESLPDDKRRAIDGEATDSALLEQQAYISRLIDIAMMEQCDWGLNYNAGLELLLPQLGTLRSSARTLAKDATRLMSLEGTDQQRAANQLEAVRRIKAVSRMSQHVKTDRILISGLVGAAINNLACSWIDERLHAGTLSTDSAQQLLSNLRSMQNDDLFSLNASVQGEWDIFDAWFKNKFAGEDAAKQLAEAIPALSDGNAAPADAIISAMSRKELDASIARMRDFYTDIADVWSKPDGRERIAKLSTAVTAGDYGPVAQRLAPALDKSWASDKKGRETYENTMKLLQAYINNNGALPADLTPPAADVR
ncbi:MAG TPA: hypothetical protein VK157_09205 [Phycisphaerales bacterium]|nr:hypothetical protein [Phycisphaerales bacterium]